MLRSRTVSNALLVVCAAALCSCGGVQPGPVTSQIPTAVAAPEPATPEVTEAEAAPDPRGDPNGLLEARLRPSLRPRRSP
jgi:hypothetical protein